MNRVYNIYKAPGLGVYIGRAGKGQEGYFGCGSAIPPETPSELPFMKMDYGQNH